MTNAELVEILTKGPGRAVRRLNEDVCLCCGMPIPEGRMVCPNCEKGE